MSVGVRLAIPDHLVNGDFEYPSYFQPYNCPVAAATAIERRGKVYACINPNNTGAANYWKWSSFGTEFDPDQFGWDSTEVGTNTSLGPGPQLRTNEVELQSQYGNNNTYAEIVGSQAGTSIYQDIATVPGTVYTWSLKHASTQSSHVDKMSVVIGVPGQEGAAQPAVRVSVNGGGDALGPVGTVIATKSLNSNVYDKQWETYTGSYTIPEGQTVTRFAFKSVEGLSYSTGNDVDDVRFIGTYPLTYDANGGTGSLPVQVEGVGTTGCYASYVDGGSFELATGAKDSDCWDSSMLAKPGARFLGWSDTRQPFIDNASKWSDAQPHMKTTMTMVFPGITVYAVWGSDKTLSFDVNTPTGHAAPVAPNAQTIGFNLGATDQSGWTVGDTSRVPGYKFTGWKTSGTGSGVGGSGIGGSFDGDTAYDFSTPMLSDTTVYAGWQPLSANITYNPNPGDGVVTGTTDPTIGVTDGSAVVSSSGFNRHGFKFNGWNTKPDGSGDLYWPSQSYERLPVGGVTLYAQWVANQSVIPFTGGQGIAVSMLVTIVLMVATSVFRWWRTRRMVR